MVFFYIGLGLSILGIALSFVTAGLMYIPIMMIININSALIMYYLDKINKSINKNESV